MPAVPFQFKWEIFSPLHSFCLQELPNTVHSHTDLEITAPPLSYSEQFLKKTNSLPVITLKKNIL